MEVLQHLPHILGSLGSQHPWKPFRLLCPSLTGTLPHSHSASSPVYVTSITTIQAPNRDTNLSLLLPLPATITQQCTLRNLMQLHFGPQAGHYAVAVCNLTTSPDLRLPTVFSCQLGNSPQSLWDIWTPVTKPDSSYYSENPSYC